MSIFDPMPGDLISAADFFGVRDMPKLKPGDEITIRVKVTAVWPSWEVTDDRYEAPAGSLLAASLTTHLC